MYFWYCVIFSPWKRAGSFIWTNLGALHRRMLCAVFGWNCSCGSWEEDIFNFVNVYLLFRNKGWCSSFEQTWIPFTQGCFVPSLVEIDPVVLEKKIKMLKVYNNNNDANYDDDGDDNVDGQRIYFDQKSLL